MLGSSRRHLKWIPNERGLRFRWIEILKNVWYLHVKRFRERKKRKLIRLYVWNRYRVIWQKINIFGVTKIPLQFMVWNSSRNNNYSNENNHLEQSVKHANSRVKHPTGFRFHFTFAYNYKEKHRDKKRGRSCEWTS